MRAALFALLTVLTAASSSALHLYQPGHEYTEAEIGELNWFELTLLANEPYARQGYVFDSDFLMNHYLATDWYGPLHG
ncbi:MAG: YARHG domain-containing protein, partial [Candidatus Coatesbacteria bacterium]